MPAINLLSFRGFDIKYSIPEITEMKATPKARRTTHIPPVARLKLEH